MSFYQDLLDTEPVTVACRICNRTIGNRCGGICMHCRDTVPNIDKDCGNCIHNSFTAGYSDRPWSSHVCAKGHWQLHSYDGDPSIDEACWPLPGTCQDFERGEPVIELW